MNEEKSQEGREGIEDENEIGGFMAGTHKLHRTNYGPNSPLPDKARIFLMIQHHLIANWQIRMAIPISVIEEETGCQARWIKRCVRQLEMDEMLLVERRKMGSINQDNIYRLHPKRFGESPLYQGEEIKIPTFQVIQGGRFVDAKKGGSVQSTTRGSGQEATRGSVQSTTTKPSQNTETIKESAPLRTIKNYKNTTGAEVESKGLTIEKVKETLLAKFPNDTHRIKEAYNHLKRAGEWKGQVVAFPEGFLLKGWQYMRSEFEYVDKIIRQKTEAIKPPVEDYDVESSDRTRNEVMKKYFHEMPR